MTALKSFLEESKARNIWKWMAIYLGAAVIVLAIIFLIHDFYNFPAALFDIVLILAVLGLVSTSFAAWHHGNKGKQKFKKNEITAHSIILIIAILLIILNVWKPYGDSVSRKIQTIAVLPVLNEGEGDEDDYFCNGLTEELIFKLSKINTLRVTSRNSVMSYKNAAISKKQVGKELGVTYILESSFKRKGKNIQISCKLINTLNKKTFWLKSYSGEVKDIFNFQNEICEKVAEALKINISSKETELIRKKPTNKIDAYIFYLKGKDEYYMYTRDSNERAIAYFNQAAALDPDFALVYAGIADAYIDRQQKWMYPGDWLDSSIVMSRKAIELDPDIDQPYFSIGLANDSKFLYKNAIKYYKKAMEINPSSWQAVISYSQANFNLGRLDEALEYAKKSIFLAPSNVTGGITIGWIYQRLGMDTLAIKWFNKSLALKPNSVYILTHIGDQFLYMMDFNKAREYCGKAEKISKNDFSIYFLRGRIETVEGNYAKAKEYFDRAIKITNAAPEYYYGFILMKLGNIEEGKKIVKNDLNNYLTFVQNNKVDESTSEMGIAEMYSILGKKDNAVEWLGKAVDKGWLDYRRNTIYPYFNSLKNDKRFVDLIDKMKQEVEQMKVKVSERENIK